MKMCPYNKGKLTNKKEMKMCPYNKNKLRNENVSLQ